MERENKFAELFRSPTMLAIVVGGLLLVLAVPYLAFQTLPKSSSSASDAPEQPAGGNPNLGIDFEELNSLPEEIAADASVILSREEPVLPEMLMEVPEPNGFGLSYPVTEAVESLQPVMSWTDFAPGPYKLTVTDQTGKTVANVENIQKLSMLLPGRLESGRIYTWQIATPSEIQQASFVVLMPEQLAQLQQVRARFAQSHLALGLAAEHFGLLTVAEREYQELGRQFPNAEAPARLLANVLALRE